MADLFDNSHKETGAPAAPDKGIKTGVSDTYGANLAEGHAGKQSFTSPVPDVDCCPGCDPASC